MDESKLTEGCQEVLDLVKTRLAFLFTDYGFSMIRQEDAKLGERCLFVLKSDDCQIKVISEFGAVGVEIGPATISAGWSSSMQGKTVWFGIYSVIEFVEGRKLSFEEIREHGRKLWSMTNDEMLADLARRLAPVAREVFALFREQVAPERRRAFEEFISG